MSIFVGDCVQTEQCFLCVFFGNPRTHAQSTFGKSVVFLCLCPMQILYFRFPFSKVFPCHTGDDLAQAMEVRAIEGYFVETLTNWMPCIVTSHENFMMSVSVYTQGRCCHQQLCPSASWCVAKELLPCQPACLLHETSECSQSLEWPFGEDVAINQLSHYSPEQRDAQTSTAELSWACRDGLVVTE